MVTPAFEFGLPSAQTNAPEYSSGILPSNGEKPFGMTFGRRTSKTPILDQEKYLSFKSDQSQTHMPSRRTVKKYLVVVLFCLALLMVSRLTGENLMGFSKSPRRFTRYIPSSLTKENLVAEHHDPEAYERFAAITANSETETHGSDWAWKPTTSAHPGLYILDDEDEEDEEADFARLKSNEEYQAVQEEVSQANAFSSLLSVDQQRRRGRSEERLNGLSPAEIVALTQLEEKNRISSLRALVAFIDSGAILPSEWEEEGLESPLGQLIDAAWTDAGGAGMESALNKVLGKRLGAKVFHRSWEEKIDNVKKLIIFSKVNISIASTFIPRKETDFYALPPLSLTALTPVTSAESWMNSRSSPAPLTSRSINVSTGPSSSASCKSSPLGKRFPTCCSTGNPLAVLTRSSSPPPRAVLAGSLRGRVYA